MLKSKRILSLLLVFVLAFSVCSFAEAMPSGGGLSNFKKVNAYEAGQFTDVAKQWYAGNVQAAYELGLMQGNPDGTFNPTGSIKVIETIVTACRLHSIYHTGKSEFPSGSPWYQPYVDYAVSNGIIGADEYSSYNAPATRAQFISILAKALPKEALQAINSIPKGSLPDVSARTAFADAVYLMYNAGILVGNDDYGTFDPDGNINRAQSAAIITRMADTSLRITKTLKEFDPNPPVSLEVYSYGSRRYTETDSSGKVLVDFWWSEYAPGQRVELLVHMKPALTQSDITWASSDPSVAYVDRYGWLEVCKQGETVITATTDNGVTGSFKIIVPDPGEQLQCELTADGTGYEVTGCDPNAYTAHIPAEYNGLPVVSIRGGAFMGCSKLRYYTVDKRQSVFYEEDGVIFADLPEKTLVCFPPAYDAAQYYYVPEDTVAVAPYGFAGLHANNLSTITMQEGLTTLGHHAFAKVSVQTDIYTPDSLVSIGEYLLQDQTSSLPFYGSADSAMCGYAQENQIPFGRIFDFDPGKNTTMARKPESIPADGMSSDPGVPVKLFSELNYMQYDRWVQTEYDISSYQTDFTGEVYLQLGKQWEAIVPDETGNVSIDMPPQTGLYGVGYTATDAVLRSYDRYGNLLAIQYVNGNFAFCFPGACDLGIVGGSETILSMIPYEPVYLISGGNYPLQADEWYTTEKGSAYQFFIQQYPSSSLQQRMPNHLNIFVAGNYGYGEGTLRSGYQIGFVELYDQSRIDVLTASLSFDGQNCVVDNDEMVCLVNSSFEGSSTFGTRALDMWRSVKQTMEGDYFPSDFIFQKIYVYADGSYPSAALSSVYMDEEIVSGRNDLTLAHEFVHAADMSIPAFLNVGHGAWAEGRAEYISNKIFGNEDTIYTGYDWSYLSEGDKTDFFRFYYFSTNRYTQYPVGTLFLRYLNQTYGEDVSGRIMANIAALTEWDSNQGSEANAAIFKKCVEDATEVGVFQNFVRDVIEK